jgi:osmotically inducible protein OsmC
MKPLYTAIVTSNGGRTGHVRSSDGVLDLPIARPADGGGTNPEQLFAAGYAACFDGAFRLAAKEANKELGNASLTAHVTLNLSEPRQFDLTVELHGHADGLPKDEVEALMRTAHEICPYSRATRGNIDVKLIVD